MTNIEPALNMLAEVSTTEISKQENPTTMPDCESSQKRWKRRHIAETIGYRALDRPSNFGITF